MPMHTHANDEILSYFRTGKAEHKDSEGVFETVGGKRLMLMKAGKWYQHEERILGKAEPMEGLQIFIRPRQADLTPTVDFLNLSEEHSDNAWRMIASPNAENTLQFSSQTWIYDVRLKAGNCLELPDFQEYLSYLLYVFKGAAKVNGLNLNKKDSVLIRAENALISTDTEAELVLLVTDEQAPYYQGGMFSGNQF